MVKTLLPMPGLSPEAPHLEFEGASLTVGEEVAGVVAEELETASLLTSSLDEAERTEARAIARELRLWVFMASVCDASDRAERDGLVERLERLSARAHRLLEGEVGEPGRASADATATPVPRLIGRIIDIQELSQGGYEDECTAVKRAKWERSANRALHPVGDGPPVRRSPAKSWAP
jgi:hypothetical protein